MLDPGLCPQISGLFGSDLPDCRDRGTMLRSESELLQGLEASELRFLFGPVPGTNLYKLGETPGRT